MKILKSVKDIKEQGSFFCEKENVLIEFDLGYIWVYDLTFAMQKGQTVALYRIKRELSSNIHVNEIMQSSNFVRYEDATTIYSPFTQIKKIKKKC